MKFGTYIKLARDRKTLSQKDLAIQVNVSPQFIHDIEHHRRTPSDDVLDRLQSLLGFDSDFAYHLLGKLPKDLRGTITRDKLTKAYKILRND